MAVSTGPSKPEHIPNINRTAVDRHRAVTHEAYKEMLIGVYGSAVTNETAIVYIIVAQKNLAIRGKVSTALDY